MYIYKDLTKEGYKKISITKEQHIKIFNRYNIHSKYKYYENDNCIVCQSFDKWYIKAINIIIYPAMLLFNGLGKFNELNKDMYRLLFQKKTGHFVSNIKWKKNIK